MKMSEWTGTALDPDERAARHAREVAGVNGIAGSLPNASLGRFDAITFNKVLEHVPRIRSRCSPTRCPSSSRTGSYTWSFPTGRRPRGARALAARSSSSSTSTCSASLRSRASQIARGSMPRSSSVSANPAASTRCVPSSHRGRVDTQAVPRCNPATVMDSLQGRKIAIIGGAGFIGHHLGLQLVRRATSTRSMACR